MILFCHLCLLGTLFGEQARIMQTLGQALDIEVFDKDEGNDDDKLGRWVRWWGEGGHLDSMKPYHVTNKELVQGF